MKFCMQMHILYKYTYQKSKKSPRMETLNHNLFIPTLVSATTARKSFSLFFFPSLFFYLHTWVVRSEASGWGYRFGSHGVSYQNSVFIAFIFMPLYPDFWAKCEIFPLIFLCVCFGGGGHVCLHATTRNFSVRECKFISGRVLAAAFFKTFAIHMYIRII